MGSRFGGLKQLAAVGPGGETLLDYGVADAVRAGFTRVVFVIRRDFEEQFRAQVGARYAGRVEVAYAFQALDDLPGGFVPPAGREKPWGTGHAVWCAREVLRDGPFAVINADDFYGRAAYEALAGFLLGPGAAPSAASGPSSTLHPPSSSASGSAAFCLVGYRLDRTLSEHGTVSRGVCEVGEEDTLRAIAERTGIAAGDVGPGRTWRGDEVVSMNCWGFTPALLPALEAGLRAFLATHGGDARAEFYLPSAVSAMIARGQAIVRVLRADATWFGVTHRDDLPRVREALAVLPQPEAAP